MSEKKRMAGIVIDPWKLAIFTRHLNQAGYAFINDGNVSDEALALRVETTNLEALAGVVTAANTECRRTGRPQ